MADIPLRLPRVRYPSVPHDHERLREFLSRCYHSFFTPHPEIFTDHGLASAYRDVMLDCLFTTGTCMATDRRVSVYFNEVWSAARLHRRLAEHFQSAECTNTRPWIAGLVFAFKFLPFPEWQDPAARIAADKGGCYQVLWHLADLHAACGTRLGVSVLNARFRRYFVMSNGALAVEGPAHLVTTGITSLADLDAWNEFWEHGAAHDFLHPQRDHGALQVLWDTCRVGLEMAMAADVDDPAPVTLVWKAKSDAALCRPPTSPCLSAVGSNSTTKTDQPRRRAMSAPPGDSVPRVVDAHPALQLDILEIDGVTGRPRLVDLPAWDAGLDSEPEDEEDGVYDSEWDTDDEDPLPVDLRDLDKRLGYPRIVLLSPAAFSAMLEDHLAIVKDGSRAPERVAC